MKDRKYLMQAAAAATKVFITSLTKLAVFNFSYLEAKFYFPS